jgi:hypothetical protein
MNENSSVFQNDYFGQTTLDPLGLVAIVFLGLAMLVVSRKYATWPMLIMACFVPPAQRVAVFALNFDLLRIIVLFGSIRIFLRAEWRGFHWNVLDYMVVAWCLYSLVTFSILFMSPEAIKYKLGFSYDVLGMYYLFRILIRDWCDIDEICRALIILSLPVLAAFLLEHSTGRNVFAALGGVPAITDIREGRLRCQGAFAHPILAGCFWASAMPLLVAQWWRQRIPRWLTMTGVVASGGIVLLCASSTPVSTMIIGIPAMVMFLWKRHLKVVLWGIVTMVLMLQLVMQHPIWWLVTYVNIVGGSTAWFRYILMQSAFDHMHEWWLIGSNLGTAHWGEGLVDVTNYYIVQGLHGGLLLLTLFFGMFVVGFVVIMRVVRRADSFRGRAIMGWAIGVALLMHAANFIGVSYFGQIQVIWYMQLAMIGSLGVLHSSSLGKRGATKSTLAYHPQQGTPLCHAVMSSA